MKIQIGAMDVSYVIVSSVAIYTGIYLLGPAMYFGSASSLIATAFLIVLSGLFLGAKDEYSPGGIIIKAALALFTTYFVLGLLLAGGRALTVTFSDSTAREYARVIGKVGEKTAEDFPKFEVDKASFVTEEIALYHANKLLSENQDRGLGNQYEINNMKRQMFQGELVFVGFLEPNGLKRYLSIGSSPGYVVVSAYDPSVSKLVLKDKNGDDLKLTVGQSGFYFSNQVDRIFYFESMSSLISFAEPVLDEEGNPFWASTVSEREVGFVFKPSKVVMINAQTKEIKQYALNEVPEFVDVVYPQRIAQNLIDYYGELSEGAWNWEGINKMRVDSFDIINSPEGNAVYIAGMTSASQNRDGLIGFMVMDPRTGETNFFRQPAVEESEVKKAVLGNMGKMQLEFNTTSPKPFAIDGRLVWVTMAYTGDNIATNKNFGFTDIKSASKTVVSPSIQVAYQKFLSMPDSGYGEQQLNSSIESVEFKAVVQRIALVKDTHQILFEGDNTIYSANSDLLIELGLTKAGDRVCVKASKGDRGKGAVTELDNLEFGENSECNPKVETASY